MHDTIDVVVDGSRIPGTDTFDVRDRIAGIWDSRLVVGHKFPIDRSMMDRQYATETVHGQALVVVVLLSVVEKMMIVSMTCMIRMSCGYALSRVNLLVIRDWQSTRDL